MNKKQTKKTAKKSSLKRSTKIQKGTERYRKTTPKQGTRTYTPLEQQERIKQKYTAGKFIRQIAREEGKARETVTKIVRSPNMEAYVEEMRRKNLRLLEDIYGRPLRHGKEGG